MTVVLSHEPLTEAALRAALNDYHAGYVRPDPVLTVASDLALPARQLTARRPTGTGWGGRVNRPPLVRGVDTVIINRSLAPGTWALGEEITA